MRRKLIEADEKAAAEGRGSFSVDGKMIDIPVIDRARRLIARHEAIERRLKSSSGPWPSALIRADQCLSAQT